MDVILDDGPFLDDRIDRPRSHTWPLPDPCLLAVDPKIEEERNPEASQPQITVSNENEADKRLRESTSPRKNNRKNAWGNLSYADLITQAIDSSLEKRLTLAQIYDWMVKNVPYFKDKGDSTSSAGWKNSIRHNLSLHNRFMRIQNDQSGKSSYWVLNPDAKPGKSPRRRSGSVDGAGKTERKRVGRSKKNSLGSPEDYGNNLSPVVSASPGTNRNGKKKCQQSETSSATSPCSSTDSLSNLPDLDENGAHFILSTDSFTRPRSTSNVSTHSSVGRLTPIPGEELEDDLCSLPDATLLGGRPRGSSAAEETASLVESLTLSRQADTINLDESLKFDSPIISNGCSYATDVSRPHSDSFSSVQSGDSGYESPASYFTTSAVQAKSKMPLHNMMPMAKAPPPYPSQQANQVPFTPIRQQQQPPKTTILGRSSLSGSPAALHTDMQGKAFFTQATQNSVQINQRGYLSSQPLRRLQHLPHSGNGVFCNNANIFNVSNNDAERNMTNMSDPILASVSLPYLKEERDNSLSQKTSYTQSMMYTVPIVPMEQDNDQFPSDLTHLELHDFGDRFQLQRDLESIIRNEMGEGTLDFEQPYVTSSNVNSISIAGQNWVH